MPLKMDLMKDYADLLLQRLEAKRHPAPTTETGIACFNWIVTANDT